MYLDKIKIQFQRTYVTHSLADSDFHGHRPVENNGIVKYIKNKKKMLDLCSYSKNYKK